MATQVGLIVPRQNGKGVLLEALELAHLVLFKTELILHSAHLFKTSSEAFRRLKHRVEANPDIERRVLKMHQAHGQEGIEFRGDQRILFVARGRGGGRGLGGGLVVLDEAFRLFAKMMADLYPTMSAQPNPQIWFTSSAPLPVEDSDYLRDLVRRGRKGDEDLAYAEWSAEPHAEDATDEAREERRRDPKVIAGANPGYGLRITQRYIRGERAALKADDYDRERLGIFPEDEAPADEAWQVIDEAAWRRGLDLRSGPVGVVSFAMDVSKDRRSGSFAVAGQSGRGGLHGEVVDHRPGVGWMVDRAKELQARWGGPIAVAAKSPAASLVPDLEEEGVEVVVVTVDEHVQACAHLFDAIEQNRFRHLDQDPLNVAVAGAVKRDIADAWLWSRRSSTVDISPLVAVGLAAWLHHQVLDPGSAYEERGLVTL